MGTTSAPRTAASSLARPGRWTSHRVAAPAATRPRVLTNAALRTRHPARFDALARSATDGSRTAERLAADALDGIFPSPRLLRRTGGSLAALALAWVGASRSADELAAGAATYAYLWRQGLADQLAFAPIHHQAAGQSLFLAGEQATLRELRPQLTRLPREIAAGLDLDLAHPYAGGAAEHRPDGTAGSVLAPDSPSHRTWEQLLSAPFRAGGRSSVDVRVRVPDGGAPEAHLFDHLTSAGAEPGSRSGPLVTVVMPCFRPDGGLLTSVRSICAQTYGDLEILLVDDASGPEYDDLFVQTAAVDERVRLVRMPSNGGSYLGRTAAIAQASGELLTFQDADDWSHPERIERQVALLREQPQAPASRSGAVRAKDDLTHQWLGYSSLRDNASSLMVRRETYDRLGPFLPIRKGADSEYAERLALVGAVADTGSPLAVTRLRSGSLSRGDFTYQWSAPERLVFKGAYRAWHRSLAGPPAAAATSDPRQLPFAVPATFLHDLPAAASSRTRVDVAFLGDFRTPAGDPDPVSALRAQLPEDGASTPTLGLWHLESAILEGTKRPEMHDRWFDAAHADPDVEVIGRTTQVHADRVVVLSPACLVLAGSQPTTVTTDEVVVWLRPEDVLPDAGGLATDLLGVGRTCRQWWGRHPRWVIAPDLQEHERRAVLEAVPDLILSQPPARPTAPAEPPAPPAGRARTSP